MRKIATLGFLVLQAAMAESPMFRGGPAHSGVYASTASPSLSTVKWKFKTAGKVISSPAIAGGVAYFGSSNSKLYAVDISNGTARWTFSAQGAVNSSPGVADGMVFFASLDGNFYAVNAATGKLAWKFKTGGERRFTAAGIHGIAPRNELMPDPFDVFLSSPAISNGIVYFGSGDYNVYALSARNGELKWKFATGDVVHASPAVNNGVVYIGSWDRFFYALDAESGALRWKFETGDDKEIHNQIGIASSATIADGAVYFGCRDSHLYALDAKTGVKRWAFDNRGGWVIASPAVEKGIVYFPTSDGTSFKALDAVSGRLLFSVTNKDISFSSPAIANGIAYYGTSDGWVHAVDLNKGKTVNEFQTDGSKENSAKYLDANGKPDNAKIFSDTTLDGVMVGLSRVYSMGSVLSSPVIVDGVLYVGSTDGVLYALQ
jgi:outer membrane protein assembly factor BamB